MSQSLAGIFLHIVFSTRNREPHIRADVEPRLHAYLATTCRENGCHAYRVGGTTDHIHIATTLSQTLTVAQLVEELKKSSSKWMKTHGSHFKSFYWQRGYGVFSVGASHLEALKRYIDRQHEHHRRITFKDEFRTFLEKYHIEYDERYVWD